MNIALEEHFIVPCLADYLEKAMPKVSPTAHDKLLAELADFGEARIAAMDAGGVGLAVLSISGPGVQVEPDTAVATKLAQQANDLLATEVQRRKDRYAGFAHLAMQDPVAAADELERSQRPHQRHLPRRSTIRAILGTHAGARRPALYPSRRQLCAAPRPERM
jgi:2,3-dihydroxybenzoate decarboxylase